MDAYRRAAEVNERLVRSSPSDRQLRSDLARCYGYIGDLRLESGQLHEAANSYRASHRIRDSLFRDRPGDGDAAFQLARGHRNFGRLHRALGRPDDAIASYRNALRIERRLADRYPDEDEYLHDLARTLKDLGVIHRETGRFAESLGSLQEARPLFERLVEAHPDNIDYAGGLASCLGAMALTHREAGRLELAYQFCHAANRVFAALEHDEVANDEIQFDEARNLATLGRLELARGRPVDARRSLEAAQNTQQRLVRSDFTNPEYRNALGVTLDSLGQTLELLGQREEALAMYRLSIESQCSALARNPRRATFWQSLKECFGHLTSAVEGEELSPEEAELFYAVSRDLASCIAAAAGFETDLAETARVGLRWTSDRAMESIRIALAGGLRDVERFRTDEAMDPLRSRTDFQDLLVELEPSTGLKTR